MKVIKLKISDHMGIFKPEIMHVSVKQSKKKSKIFNDKRYTLQWPPALLSDSTLTRFVVIKDLQLAMVGWGFH